jgi:hypothetical protein
MSNTTTNVTTTTVIEEIVLRDAQSAWEVVTQEQADRVFALSGVRIKVGVEVETIPLYPQVLTLDGVVYECEFHVHRANILFRDGRAFVLQEDGVLRTETGEVLAETTAWALWCAYAAYMAGVEHIHDLPCEHNVCPTGDIVTVFRGEKVDVYLVNNLYTGFGVIYIDQNPPVDTVLD